MKRIINLLKNNINYFCLFLVFIIYFLFNYKYYDQVNIIIDITAPQISTVDVYYDTGFGFNNLQKNTIKSILNSRNFYEILIPLPRAEINAIKIESLEKLDIINIYSINKGKKLNIENPKINNNEAVLNLSHLENSKFNYKLVYIQFLFSIFLTLFIYALMRKINIQNISSLKNYCKDNKSLFLIFSIIVSFQITWLLAFYPAGMTSDSWATLDEIQKINFTDWHPYIYTLYVMMLLNICNSVATVSVFQILITSLISANIFNYLIRENVNKILLILIFIIYCTSIPIGNYNLMIWKDIPFSIIILLLSYIFFRIKLSNEKTQKKYNLENYEYIFVFILICGLGHIRHNGVLVLIFSLVFSYLLFEIKSFRKIIYCFLFSIVFIFIINPKILNINMNKGAPLFQFITTVQIITHPNFYSSNRIQDIACFESASGIPFDVIKKSYPQDLFGLWDSSKFVKEGLQFQESGGNTECYNKYSLMKLVLNNMSIYFGYKTYELVHSLGVDQSNSNETIGFFQDPLQLFGSNLVPPGSFTNQITIFSYPISSISMDILSKYSLYSRNYDGFFSPQVLVWQLIVPIFIFIIILLINPYLSAISFFIYPSMIALISVYLPGAGQSWRYFYYIYLCGIFVVPLYLSYLMKKKHE